jgi:hypothetical protein
LAAVRVGNVNKYVRRNGDIAWTSEPGATVQAAPLFGDWPVP